MLVELVALTQYCGTLVSHWLGGALIGSHDLLIMWAGMLGEITVDGL